MKRGLAVAFYSAVAVAALGPGIRTAAAQAPVQCTQFTGLTAATQKKANAVQAAMKAKTDPKEVCKLMTAFFDSEAAVVKFLVDNQTWCGIPAQMVSIAKVNHEKSQKFRDSICNENAPQRKVPTLSDAIKTPTVDSVANTKTGGFGTFDSLTGNPLGK